jgi:hypothetical protein
MPHMWIFLFLSSILIIFAIRQSQYGQCQEKSPWNKLMVFALNNWPLTCLIFLSVSSIMSITSITIYTVFRFDDLSQSYLFFSQSYLFFSQFYLFFSQSYLFFIQSYLFFSPSYLFFSQSYLFFSQSYLYFQSVLSIFQSVLSIFQSVLSIFQSVLSIFQSVLSIFVKCRLCSLDCPLSLVFWIWQCAVLLFAFCISIMLQSGVWMIDYVLFTGTAYRYLL